MYYKAVSQLSKDFRWYCFSTKINLFLLFLVLGIFTQSVKSEELLNDARNVKPPKVIQKLAENPKDRAIA